MKLNRIKQMRYTITYKNGEVKTCDLTESAFDQLIANHFDEIDLIMEAEDMAEATGYDFYGPIQLPDEDEGTFRIYYNGGNGDEQYLKKSRNGRFIWLDKHNFDYDNGKKPFETNDYQLALQLIDKFGGTVKKVEDIKEAFYTDDKEKIEIEKAPNGKYFINYNREVSPSFTGPFDSEEEAVAMLKKHRPNAQKVDEATEVEPDMFDSEYDKTFVDGRQTHDFYDVYNAMNEIAPNMSYSGDAYIGKELNLIYYPNSKGLSKEEFERIKQEMFDKFGKDVSVKGASSAYAPEQRKIYVGYIETPDEDEELDEANEMTADMSSSLDTVKEYIDYLFTHNKNYTKEQYDIIDELKDAIQNNADVKDLENKMYILTHHNKNYNRAQYNLITELDEILKKNNYQLKNNELNEANHLDDKSYVTQSYLESDDVEPEIWKKWFEDEVKKLGTKDGDREKVEYFRKKYEQAKQHQNSNLDEGFKDSLKKAGKYAKGAIAAGVIAGGLMGNPADVRADDYEEPVAVEQKIDGTIVDQFGNEYTQEQWEALISGEDPFYDGARSPDTDESVDESIFDDMDKDINKFYNDADEFIQKQKDNKDVVFFVKEPNEYTGEDEITAVFPNDIADSKGNVTVYAHLGQHSAGDLDYMLSLPEANTEEYNDLLQELNNIGYTNLNIISKDEVSNVDESCKVDESDFGLEDDADWMKTRLKDVKHIKAKLDAETNPKEKEELKRDYDFARKEFIRQYGREDLLESDLPINDVEVDKEVLDLEPSVKGWEMLDLTGIMKEIEKSDSPLSDETVDDDMNDAKMNAEDVKAEKARLEVEPSDEKVIKESFIIR